MTYIVLALGSLGLSLVYAYLVWEKRRLFRLRHDLLVIRTKLQERAKSLGCLDDPGYRWCSREIDTMIERPYLFDWSWLIAISVVDPKISITVPTSDNLQLRAAIEEARNERAWRHVGHLLYETGTGMAIRFFLWIVPTCTRPATERRAKRYCEKVDGVGFPSTWAVS